MLNHMTTAFLVNEVADHLKVDFYTMHRLAKTGRFPSFKVGSLRRIKKLDLENMYGTDICSTTVFTPAEVARILRIERCTVYAMIRNGTIHSIRVGGSIRMKKSDLDVIYPGVFDADPAGQPEQSEAATV